MSAFVDQTGNRIRNDSSIEQGFQRSFRLFDFGCAGIGLSKEIEERAVREVLAGPLSAFVMEEAGLPGGGGVAIRLG